MTERLGAAIKRLRLTAGYTLRGFAEELGISAAHQSDIEHGRRMPSDALLRKTAERLGKVGTSFEQLKALDSRLEPDVQAWIQQSPEVAQMLRKVKDSGRTPSEILNEIEKMLEKDED